MSDTSILATGAALYQFQENDFYIVGYNSKKLPSAVKNYSITELELFGVAINIFAFRHVLTGIYFEVYCDHSALAHIFKSKKKTATTRIERLIEHLHRFNFSIYYLPGQKMHIADLLSRLAGKDLDPPDRVIPISFNAMQSLASPLRRSPRLKYHQDQKHINHLLHRCQLLPNTTIPRYVVQGYQILVKRNQALLPTFPLQLLEKLTLHLKGL